MQRLILALGFTLLACDACACGPQVSYRATEIASLTALGLFVLAALLLPSASILDHRNTTLRRLLVLGGIVVTGLGSAGALIAVNSDPYMIPAALVLIAATLFVPVSYLFLQALLAFRARHGATSEG